MKNIFTLMLIMVLSFSFYACNDETSEEPDSNIEYSDLPPNSREMLQQYFGGKNNVSKIIEIEVNNLTLYRVYTVDEYEIVFNEAGYWQEIDAPYNKTIPTGLIPSPILQTLRERYYGYGVIEINTEGENYHLVLSNNQGGASIDMLFNQSGEIISESEID